MKIFVAAVSLALALSTFMTAAQKPPAAPPLMSADLKSEFLRWKASPPGQQAYQKGFVPPASKIKKISIASVDEPTLEELTRFQNALDTIARMRKE